MVQTNIIEPTDYEPGRESMPIESAMHLYYADNGMETYLFSSLAGEGE